MGICKCYHRFRNKKWFTSIKKKFCTWICYERSCICRNRWTQQRPLLAFHVYNTTKYKLFEYMVFYPYYHILHTVIKEKNKGIFVFPNKLRRTGHNEEFITEWPKTGSPPTISNFKNMHSYIKWWKKQKMMWINHGIKCIWIIL